MTFTSPEGARSNLDFLLAQMEANPTKFSVEVYNEAGVAKTFTQKDIEANPKALHDYLGNPYDTK